MFDLEEVVTIERGECRNKQWGGGGVCDDEWDEKDSAVVCRRLGLSEEGGSRYSQYQYNIMQVWYFMSTAL